MNKRLQDVLQGTYGNYIMPFFWQHGADEAVLRDYMEKIYDCGIKAVCLEARPHPQYAGDMWWRDVDIIMDEARARNMRVWILDDSHFPTGFANGAMKDAPDHLKRWYLIEHTMEVDGPLANCRFEVASHLGYDIMFGRKSEYKPEELVAVILGQRVETQSGVTYTNLQDVTANVRGGWLYMDIPDGNYCIFTYTKKIHAVDKAWDHVSFLEKESVRYLIDAVYEPHFAHYKDDFGKTFVGFFSDEPGFYNLPGFGFGMVRIGDMMPLPWSDGVRDLFASATGGSLVKLPGLYHSIEGDEYAVRFYYMDIITKKYEENFSRQLGDWCADHGVEYIGHVLEDCGLTGRLGPGTGHYFRAMAGQHMGGVDVVLNQLLPGHDYGQGAFYHYGLATCAASCAHQNPRMQGRAMCEIFGAFGWSEGINMMKWMADHMLVNGINWFVPHAFSEQEFPDPDCPPHFYARGNNSQYRHMHILYEYMNRMSHLLNGGQAAVDVAVFFPAEGEWTGGSAPFERIGKVCLQHQIPYEIVCMDDLKNAQVKDGRLIVGNASYKYLFIDSTDRLPQEFLDVLEKISKAGIAVYCVDKTTASLEDGRLSGLETIAFSEILSIVSSDRHCQTVGEYPWFRCYEYVHEDMTVYMLSNASMAGDLDVTFSLPTAEVMVRYDVLKQKALPLLRDDNGMISLHLDKGESTVIFAGTAAALDIDGAGQALVAVAAKDYSEDVLDTTWKISIADYNRTDVFRPLKETKVLTDVALDAAEFSGIIRYETNFNGAAEALRLNCCYEAAEVFINDQSAGTCITYPYVYDIADLCKDGGNTLRIEVATTLANACMDGLSMQRPVEPEGILGDVVLLK